ncbi:MAG TPA: hypothetical protein VGX76_20565, partial [Pirellulales bacterium]|nr:hypothetical protein [Pirellulales bacterium]
MQADLEETQWRISQLDETRGKTATQLADDRLRLSHVEDHARRLRQQLDQLRGAMAATEQLGGADTQERQQELVAAAAKVRQAQQALAEALRTAKQRSATYSVVPYEGPNVTRRRPVYIECRAESVVLQPEGIELAPEDFSLLGPGNPLASTLRAMQEYFTRQSGGANASEPYPLLLVRPEGVGAYYAARAALDTWGSDFGYELVGSDWKLTFPEPDSRLAELTRKVLAEARVRQQEYVLASSQLARSRPRATFHASARGGFAAERGTGGGRGGASGAGAGGWDSLGSNWAARRGPGSGGDGSGKSGTPDDGSSALAGAGGGTGVNGGGSSGAASAGLGPGGGSLASNSGNPGAGSRYQVADARYGSASARGADGLATDNGPPSGNGGSDTTSAQARPGGMSSDTSSFAGGQGSPSAGSANRPPGSAGGSTSSGGSTSPGGSSSSGGSSSPDGTPSAPSLSLNATVPSSQSKKTKSMATARGRNWGLPDTGPAAAAATRPILVECHNDRLVILPESSNQV